jgi:hypothetical protein
MWKGMSCGGCWADRYVPAGVTGDRPLEEKKSKQEPPYYGAANFGFGYHHFQIKPHPLGDLTHAEASIKTVRGIISSSWKRTEDSFVLEIEIPVGSTAEVNVPTLGLKDVVITEGGKAIWKNERPIDGVAGIAGARRDSERVTFGVGSGSYRFELKGKALAPAKALRALE